MNTSRAEVRVACGDAAAAAILMAALQADDPGHIDVRVDGSDLVLVATADSRMGLLRTLDDALQCLRAAEDPAAPQTDQKG